MKSDKAPYPVVDLKTKRVVLFTPSVKRFVLLRTVYDIAFMKDGDCGLTTTSNFPLADGIVKGVTLNGTKCNLIVNFTLGLKHAGSLKSLPTIVGHLGTSKTVEMFVVPETKLHKFKGSNHQIGQCVTTVTRMASQDAILRSFNASVVKSALGTM